MHEIAFRMEEISNTEETNALYYNHHKALYYTTLATISITISNIKSLKNIIRMLEERER